MRGLRRHIPVLAVIALPALYVGCTEDNPTRPPIEVVTPQPPPPPTHGIIASTSFGNFQAGLWVGIPIQVPQRGVVDISVDWTFPDSWIYVYFGADVCGYNQLMQGQCKYVVASETTTPKPRLLNAGLLDAGTYYIYLYNVPPNWGAHTGSEHTESVSIQVGLTIATSSGRSDQAVRLGRPTFIPLPRP